MLSQPINKSLSVLKWLRRKFHRSLLRTPELDDGQSGYLLFFSYLHQHGKHPLSPQSQSCYCNIIKLLTNFLSLPNYLQF